MISKYGFKSVRGERLLWWKQTADPAYWHEKFVSRVQRMHNRVEEDQAPEIFTKILTRHLPRDGRILEAGCGSGWCVAALKKLGYDIEGVDNAAELIELVNREYPDMPLRVADVLHVDVPDDYYEGYVSLGVIEHRFEGPEPFLDEAKRIVAADGVFCIAVPHYNFLRRLKNHLGLYGVEGQPNNLQFYQFGYTPAEFARVLGQSGLQVTTFEYYGTRRCFQEELGGLMKYLERLPFLWRIPKELNVLDGLGVASHMIMAICRVSVPN